MYQIYLDELYGDLLKPNEEEKKKYANAVVVSFSALYYNSSSTSKKNLFYLCRLADKKVAIGYTYEDSTLQEPNSQSDKDEDDSENSESEEDEVIPDIGEEK